MERLRDERIVGVQSAAETVGAMFDDQSGKPVIFAKYARQRMQERGTGEEDVLKAIRTGEREAGQRGLFVYRLNLEFRKKWAGRYYGIQQVVPVIAEEPDRWVVVTVYVFYFQESERP